MGPQLINPAGWVGGWQRPRVAWRKSLFLKWNKNKIAARVVTVVCLSHLENYCQVSNPGNETPFSPPHHFHLDRVYFSSHTHNCRKEKNPHNCQAPRPVTRDGAKGKKRGRTRLLLTGLSKQQLLSAGQVLRDLPSTV